MLRGRHTGEREKKEGDTGLGLKNLGNFGYSKCMWAMSQYLSQDDVGLVFNEQ